MGYTISAVNGMSSWIETFAEVGFSIGQKLTEELNLGVVDKTYESQGRTGLYELAVSITNSFEELNRNRPWDGEFFDEIDEFIHRQLNPDDEPEPGAMTNQELFESIKDYLPEGREYLKAGGGDARSEMMFIAREHCLPEEKPVILLIIENIDGERRQFYNIGEFIDFVVNVYEENEENAGEFKGLSPIRKPVTFEECKLYFRVFCANWNFV